MPVKAILAICALAASFATAQTLEFEVATIKPFQWGPGVMGLGPSIKDGFSYTRTDLLRLIAAAYGVGEPQIVGPPWLRDDDFEIQARVPAGVPNSDHTKPSDPNMAKMLQVLLKKRFSLSTHTETRATNVYELVVVKGGVKMTPYPDLPDGPPHGPKPRGADGIHASTSIPRLAMLLSLPAGRPVIDKTGLAGQYSIDLYYAPVSPGSAAQEIDVPILTDAIQQQLGLKLQPAKEPMPVIVVDHIEKNPTEN